MKKLLLTAAMVLVSLSVYAQGTVNFVNTTGSRVTDATTGNTTVPGSAGIVAALYWAPLSDPDNFTQIGTPAGVGVGQPPGIYNGGPRTTGAATPGGANARFQVRAWEVAYGATYEAAIAAPNMSGRPAKRGSSNIIEVKTGNPANVPPDAPGALTGLQGFAVNVPEPSVIALGVIGAGALLLLRRRK